MEKFEKHTGLVAAMDRSNVDTDQIIPKQFLKRIERTGFGQFLFYDWRFDEYGAPRPEFELNKPENDGASILLVRRDFGTGSSREHAVWALADYGFKCVICETFGDIFYNNCFKNGLLPVRLDSGTIEQLFQSKRQNPAYRLEVDLLAKCVRDELGWEIPFEVEEYRRQNLLEGLDDIGLTLKHADKIAEYEEKMGMSPTSPSNPTTA